jgi:RNA polymerase sigma-70 factor (ECF subfamily)
MFGALAGFFFERRRPVRAPMQSDAPETGMHRRPSLDTFVGRMSSFERASAADSAVLSAIDGDVAALGHLYDEHHAAVYRFACRMLGETHAWDVVQDTFMTLPKALRRWNGEGALRTFIIGIAVNHARHHVRSSARRRNALGRLALEPELDTGSTPEQTAERQRLAGLLLRALDALSFEHRSVFVLCEVEERGSPEVAQILGVPEGTVRTRLFHARQKLRAALEKAGAR